MLFELLSAGQVYFLLLLGLMLRQISLALVHDHLAQRVHVAVRVLLQLQQRG